MAKCECDEFRRANLSEEFTVYDYNGMGGWVERKQITEQFRADIHKFKKAVWLDAKKSWVKWIEKCPTGLCAVEGDENHPPWTVSKRTLSFQFDYAESASGLTSRYKVTATFELLTRRLHGTCVNVDPRTVRFTQPSDRVRTTAARAG